MSEPTGPPTWQPASDDEVAWLLDVDEIGCTGFDPAGWPDTAWVLNAIYERSDVASGLTHDDVHRIEVAAGTAEPLIIGGLDLTTSTVIGGGTGWNSRPGSEYRRLRWQELAARTGQPVVTSGRYPAYITCCGGPGLTGSWPAHLQVPTEGSLDVESWLRLMGCSRLTATTALTPSASPTTRLGRAPMTRHLFCCAVDWATPQTLSAGVIGPAHRKAFGPSTGHGSCSPTRTCGQAD